MAPLIAINGLSAPVWGAALAFFFCFVYLRGPGALGEQIGPYVSKDAGSVHERGCGREENDPSR